MPKPMPAARPWHPADPIHPLILHASNTPHERQPRMLSTTREAPNMRAAPHPQLLLAQIPLSPPRAAERSQAARAWRSTVRT